MAEKIILLEAKKKAIFERVNKMYEISKKELNKDTRSLEYFIAQSETLSEVREQFIAVIDELNMLSIKNIQEFVPDFQVLNTFEDLISHIKYKRSTLLQAKISLPSSSANKLKNSIKLPAIEIPQFDGKIENWSVFYESFKTNIHCNETLNDSQRIQYLIGKLSHSALNVIAGMVPAGENYSDIWNSLEKKYQDKRCLGSHYVNNIFDLKSTLHNASSLNHFSEKLSSSVAALKQLKIDDLFDFVIFCYISRKLDSQTVNEFEMTVRDKEIPTLSELIDFIKEKSKILERTSGDNKHISNNSRQQSSNFKNNPRTVSKSFMINVNPSNTSIKCTLCKATHAHFYQCDKFKELSPKERFNFIKVSNGCINCLSLSHKSNTCKSKHCCKRCNKRHNTLLHFDENAPLIENVTIAQIPSTSTTRNVSTSLCTVNNKMLQCSNVVLSTAQVYVNNDKNNKKLIRCLVDNASQNHLIDISCCKKLNLEIIPLANSFIKGVGKLSQSIYGYTLLQIESKVTGEKYNIQCLVLDCITESLPNKYIDPSVFQTLNTIPLADCEWYIPGKVDLVLGAQLFPYILTGNRIQLQNLPPLIGTSLGYLIMGDIPQDTENNYSSAFSNNSSAFFTNNTTAYSKNNTTAFSNKTTITALSQTQPINSISCYTISNTELEYSLQKFWEIEEIPSKKYFSPDEVACENMYRSSVKQSESGQYIVALPFCRNPSELGNSRVIAQRRLNILERKFKNDPSLHNSYNDVIIDYIKNGYLCEVSPQDDTDDGYIIPHQAVIRQDKVTSKVRIVLDASAKTHTGVSLNDILHAGPNLQADLFLLLLNFRLFAIAITADIKQMYLRIGMVEEHQKFQKILYRFSLNEDVRTFKFKCVPFGLKSSPFLAMRTLHELASNESQNFPRAAEIAVSNFYMDDLVKSVPESENNQKEKELVQELVSFFKKGGFDLIKFTSNATNVLSNLPSFNCSSVSLSDNANMKILGMEWIPETDFFSFKISQCNEQCTKRNILSVVAKLFDVLGLVSPVILFAKLLIKSLWNANIGWDELAPNQIIIEYKKLINELPLLSTLKIPRYLGVKQNCTVNIVAFCDASLKAYGAAIYLHVTDSHGNISVNLVCSKSKVAPMKVISLARLELCSAVLLAKLVRTVYNSFHPLYPIDNIYAFSDSTIALSWIHSSPHRWSIFIANRIANIQENLDPKHFYHISGIENPSDCLSRGILPSQLLQHSLWWNGPSWLVQPIHTWPIKPFLPSSISDLPELNSKTFTTVVKESSFSETLVLRVSNWKKLLRIMVYILKFLKKIPKSSSIEVDHLNLAENYIIRIIQQNHFCNEYQSILKGKSLPNPLRKLNLFIDPFKIIRIGGRLSNSDLPFEAKHPVLLPKSDRIVDLLIDDYHTRNCHTGAHLLNSIMKQRYWIISARNIIRKRVRLCNSCFRAKPQIPQPKMADLPSFRVRESCKAFIHSAVDYAGPLRITLTRRRGQRSQKAYLCVFTCLATRAVHIELASDLSSDTFLAAFKRFLSRRGPVSHLYSDNGSNFIGTKAQLNEIYNLTTASEFQTKLKEELLTRKIVWKMNPPHAPHFGGSWESQVKCFKTHLYRVIGSQLLTYEELLTVLTQIECILNSRPLCLLSEEPNIEVLTPAHFLMSTPLQYFPAPDVSSERIDLLSRKHLLDSLVQSYWKRWRLEYLHTLQARQKWATDSNPVTKGTIVLVDSGDAPPLRWPLGKIEEVYPGSDGVVRVALVRTKTGLMKRPVVRLCPLPTQ